MGFGVQDGFPISESLETDWFNHWIGRNILGEYYPEFEKFWISLRRFKRALMNDKPIAVSLDWTKKMVRY